MKKILTLLLILVAVSHFGTTQVFAQKKLKHKEVIILEFLIPKQEEPTKVEVPIEKNTKDAGVGGGAVHECGFPEKCDNSNYWTYTFSANAFRTKEALTKVNFEIKVTGGCKTRKTLSIYRNRKTKLQLECGVSLVAYYSTKSREAN